MDLSSEALFEIGGQALFAIAFGTSIVAFLMSSIVWLRIFMFVSYAAYAIYHFAIPPEPLWMDTVSEAGLALINIVMLLVLYIQQQRVRLSDKEKAIYESQFSGMPLLEFYRLLKAGEWEVYDPGTRLIENGKVVDHLYYVYGGDMEILRGDGVRIQQPAGSFVGELSFNLRQPATATVVTADTSVVLQWDQETLRRLFRSSPTIKAHLEAMLAQHMARKLAEMKGRDESGDNPAPGHGAALSAGPGTA